MLTILTVHMIYKFEDIMYITYNPNNNISYYTANVQLHDKYLNIPQYYKTIARYSPPPSLSTTKYTPTSQCL